MKKINLTGFAKAVKNKTVSGVKKASNKIIDNKISNATTHAVAHVINTTKDSTNYVKDKAKSVKNVVSGINNSTFIEEIQSNTKYSKLSIFILLLFTWFVLDCAYDYVEFVKSLSFTNIFGILSAIVSLVLITALVYFLVNDILGIITLNQQQEFREEVNNLIKSGKVEELKELLLNYKLTKPNHKKKLMELFEQPAKGGEIVAHYEEVVLKSIDKKVNKTINKYSLLSSGANLISNKTWLDFIITQLIFSKMLIDIAKEYNIKLGICTFSKIMTMGLIGSSVSTLATKILGSAINSVPVLNKFTEIAVPAVIMRHLGLKLKYAIRPIRPQSAKLLEETLKETSDEKIKE